MSKELEEASSAVEHSFNEISDDEKPDYTYYSLACLWAHLRKTKKAEAALTKVGGDYTSNEQRRLKLKADFACCSGEKEKALVFYKSFLSGVKGKSYPNKSFDLASSIGGLCYVWLQSTAREFLPELAKCKNEGMTEQYRLMILGYTYANLKMKKKLKPTIIKYIKETCEDGYSDAILTALSQVALWQSMAKLKSDKEMKLCIKKIYEKYTPEATWKNMVVQNKRHLELKNAEYGIHVIVDQEETLVTIADTFVVTTEAVKALNPNVDWDNLKIGQEIKYPSPR